MSNQNTAHNVEHATKTLGSMMGEIVWLMTQSPLHKLLHISDLEWLLMPPILLNQYKLFYENGVPVGAALWAYLSEEGEARLKESGRINPEDWGNGALVKTLNGFSPSPGGTLWLVELIAPFATTENQQREQMLSDLLSTNLVNQSIKLIHVSPESKAPEEITLGGVK